MSEMKALVELEALRQRTERAMELVKQAALILEHERYKIEEGEVFASAPARDALGWNIDSALGRLSMARAICTDRSAD